VEKAALAAVDEVVADEVTAAAVLEEVVPPHPLQPRARNLTRTKRKGRITNSFSASLFTISVFHKYNQRFFGCRWRRRGGTWTREIPKQNMLCESHPLTSQDEDEDENEDHDKWLALSDEDARELRRLLMCPFFLSWLSFHRFKDRLTRHNSNKKTR
jgi:hypothetical protein